MGPPQSDWIRRAIQNPVYYGAIRFAGQIYAGQHEPIVTKEVWAKANAALAARLPQAPKLHLDRDINFHLLKGYLFCAVCNRAMIPSPASKRDKHGRPYRYYCCGHLLKERNDARCPVARVSAAAVEQIVIATFGHLAKHPEVVAAGLSAGKDSNKINRDELAQRMREVERGLEETNHTIANLIAAIAKKGALTEELNAEAQRRKQQQQALMVERERLRQAVAALEGPALDAAQFAAALGQFDIVFGKLNHNEQKELVGLFLKRIDIAPVEHDPASDSKSRTLLLRFHWHFPHLMLQGGDTTFLKVGRTSASTRPVKMDVRVRIPTTRNGELGIVAPFACQLSTPREESEAKARHPIYRANEWSERLKKDPSLTAGALADQVGVSPATMSQQLQLTRLCTRVRKALLALDDRRIVWRLSYRRLKPLFALPAAEQWRQFRALCERFGGRREQADAVRREAVSTLGN